MVIRAIFPPNTNAVQANKPLYQWDRGQWLQIESTELPALFEVHFEYEGIDEAIVRLCSMNDGIGMVAIPDICLEQSSEITAWIYCIDSTAGSTEKKITVKVKERTKPQPGENSPVDTPYTYSDVIATMNEAVNALKNGDVVLENANNAKNAENAKNAKNAEAAAKLVGAKGEVDADYLVDVKNGEKAVPKATDANTAAQATWARFLDLNIEELDTEEYELGRPGVYVVLLGTSSTRTCDIIALSSMDKDVFSEHVKYEPADKDYGYLRPYNDAGNIRIIIPLALGAFG